MRLDTDRLRMLSEHYRDTFDILQNSVKRRDRLFVGVLLILIFMLFQLYTPKSASIILSEFIVRNLDLTTPVNMFFIQSIVWFSLLALALKYFQSVVSIERQYDYIHDLEELLSAEYNNKAFTREGKTYATNYPKFLKWASFLYTILFPVILIVISASAIVEDFINLSVDTKLRWVNVSIFIMLMISIYFYMRVLHSNQKEES